MVGSGGSVHGDTRIVSSSGCVCTCTCVCPYVYLLNRDDIVKSGNKWRTRHETGYLNRFRVTREVLVKYPIKSEKTCKWKDKCNWRGWMCKKTNHRRFRSLKLNETILILLGLTFVDHRKRVFNVVEECETIHPCDKSIQLNE